MDAICRTVEDTRNLAREFAGCLRAGDVILLIGDLGAGKTHFTQGLARGLGIGEDPTSPTFNLMCVYDGGRLPLYHFDLYRLDTPDQLDDIDYYGVTEGDGVSAVEWGDKFAEAAPDECLVLRFSIMASGERLIEAVAAGQRGCELEHAFGAAAQAVKCARNADGSYCTPSASTPSRDLL